MRACVRVWGAETLTADTVAEMFSSVALGVRELAVALHHERIRCNVRGTEQQMLQLQQEKRNYYIHSRRTIWYHVLQGRVHVKESPHTHTHTYTNAHTRARTHTHTCKHTHTHTQVQRLIPSSLYSPKMSKTLRIYIRTYIRTYVHTYILTWTKYSSAD